MKFRAAVTALSLFFLPLVYAEYHLYFMNNTHDELTVNNACDIHLSQDRCSVYNNGKLQAFKRVQSHSVNYDSGIHHGHRYSLINTFSLPGDEGFQNYVETTLEGDLIGSHIVDIKLNIDGQSHTLLDSNNSKSKVKSNQLASFKLHHRNEDDYFFYVSTQKDHYSDQGIDSVYFTVDKKPVILSSDANNELTVITYNIQLFPIYAAAALDLNKPSTRTYYLANMDALKHADVVVFEEAWDHGSRAVLKNGMQNDYPYHYDPVPSDTHHKPLNSGLLIFSRYPMTTKTFFNYQDYQSLVDADQFSNKGAAYFRIDKNGKGYNFVATHVQAQNDPEAVMVRQAQFRIIKNEVIGSTNLSINPQEPLLIVGDTNTNYYNESQFGFMKSILNLNSEGVLKNIYKTPKFSCDYTLNLMIPSSDHERALYDYVLPVKGFLQPSSMMSQITPLRAVDDVAMYSRSWIPRIYNYGNIELSDHFMVQAKFTFSGY